MTSDKVNTMMIVTRILAGALLAVTIVTLARRARALSSGGAVAAAVMGTVAVAAGWSWAALLITYFVISSAISRLGRRQKLDRTAGVVGKAGPRDARQVFANGLPFLVGAVATAIGGAQWPWMAIAAGSLAASAADTWATEIGTLVGHTPRSILTLQPVRIGESGGMTLAGTVASVGGSLFVAGTTLVCGWPHGLFLPVFAGGIVGSIVDSLAGATAQRRSWCDACGQRTEMRVHTCGTATRHTGGLSWLENDGVNLLATVTGALTAVVL